MRNAKMNKTRGWTRDTSPFHRGETAVQERLGVREGAERLGRRVIRDFFPEQHRDFYSQLPFLIVGTLDEQGSPWASLIAGPEGFISSPDPQHLNIDSAPLYGSPLAHQAIKGAAIGMLGILPEERRRNRAAGQIVRRSADRLEIAIDQAFGNCPQYIQSREIEALPGLASPAEPRQIDQGENLDEAARQLIREADTLFIATAYGDRQDGPQLGADVSHRGGRPGFVRVDDNGALIFPDFTGNNHFNTLGNIELTGRAGLMFIDFDSGDLLYLTGRATIIWESEDIEAFAGAQRFVRIEPTQWRRVSKSLPLRFHFDSYAPLLEQLGSWEDVDKRREELKSEGAWQTVEVSRLEQESADIRSVYLRPLDGPVISHEPGQFLPVRLPINEGVERVYSLSSAHDGRWYRLSIKRDADGVASAYIHDELKVGDRFKARIPAGQFVLDRKSARPVVLLSAGVGITPMLAMAQALSAEATSNERINDNGRPLYFIHGTSNGATHAFGEELAELRRRNKNLRVHTAYSRPRIEDRVGRDFNAVGRVNIDLLRSVLPFDDFDFYLCGPGEFMQSLYTDLRNAQVPDERIRFEAFGPSTVKRSMPKTEPEENAQPLSVEFAQSGIVAQWTPASGTLLELAEANGIDAAYSCRSGVCGACATKLDTGNVDYVEQPAAELASGEVLICSARPRTPNSQEPEPLVLQL
ncbi:MAG: ferredoxin-NADP reductase [Glaciecola sp.]|jgi:ferredoxin-NADP reductase/predicted pyridoxine 5'-phosphate oxidase superfamily flavin-nucleotide-binding protein